MNEMNAFIAIIFARPLSRLGYQMARAPVLPIFAADLGAIPELIGVVVAASTMTGVFFKLPSGALSDVRRGGGRSVGAGPRSKEGGSRPCAPAFPAMIMASFEPRISTRLSDDCSPGRHGSPG
jgi:hypothetical protein